MARRFNVTGSCNPNRHYMVDITDRLEKIKKLIDNGDYFTINRARQYGKTTTIQALGDYLKNDYIVISLDFQMIGNAKFANEHTFCVAFSNYLNMIISNKQCPVNGLDNELVKKISKLSEERELFAFDDLFPLLSNLCSTAEKPVVMIIDEVDSATNNQVFLDFLAQLRGYYLKRDIFSTFQSVILAGVTDVKNIKMKIRPDAEHKINSPWNIASDFLVDMSFNTSDIKGMLTQYEEDHHTGMDLDLMAKLIYDSTSGYPFLVSRICLLIDERIAGTEQFPDEKSAWTKEGYIEAEKMIISEKNTLFDSLTGKLTDYPELKAMLKAILFNGLSVGYVAGNLSIEMAEMYGFIKKVGNTVMIANRIFETVLYNLFFSEEELKSAVYASALSDKYQFIKNGHLDMKLVLERFIGTFSDLYEDESDKFKEEIGRKYFMLFLRPIINGTGHSYVEARTRNMRRTDLVVNYHDEEFVIEMKIWNGQKYHEDGEKQLTDYLESLGLKEGYMLVFNFNKNKKTEIKEVKIADYTLIEAFV